MRQRKGVRCSVVKMGPSSWLSAFLCIYSLATTSAAAPWRDCSPATDGQFNPETTGPFAVVVEQTERVAGVASYPTYRPANLTVAQKWPVYVFMHGSGCDDRFLAQSLELWASHGLIVVAPFMGIEPDCTSMLNDGRCSDKSPDGRPIQDAIVWLKQQNIDPDSPLYSRVDFDLLAVGGWSMGGVSTIKALAAMPAGTVRAVVLDSASVIDCGFFYNYSQQVLQADYAEARRRTSGATHAPWLLYTASNDFLHDANLKLFNECGANGTSIYAQYKTKHCRDRPPFLNLTIWTLEWETGDLDGFKGHFCCGTLTMTAWATTYLKLVLQQRSNTSSMCHNMLWGSGANSIANDSHIDVLHRVMAV